MLKEEPYAKVRLTWEYKMQSLPLIHFQVCPQGFHVFNEVPRGVLIQAGMWSGAPTPSLIKQDDPIVCRVVEAPVGRPTA